MTETVDKKLTTYEICVVSKQYRTMFVQAEDEEAARDLAWCRIADGFETTTKAEEFETDLYVEGEA